MKNRITALKQEIKRLEKIKKVNEQFNKLTLKQKRIAICKDALAQIATEKYLAQGGAYCHIPNIEGEAKRIEDLSEIVCDAEAPTCNVCAKGALFLSQVRKANNFPVVDIMEFSDTTWSTDIYEDDFHDYQEKIFTRYQLDLIEYVFERGTMIPETIFNSSDKYKANSFISIYANSDDEELLVAILKNMIKNEGIFKP